MERWENRYAHSRGGAVRGVEHSRADRIKNILLILLTVALVGVSIAGGQAIAFRNEADDALFARMLTECNDAINHVNTLSRYGGSDSAALIAKIRANVRTVDACNALHTSLYGKTMVPQTTFTNLYATIDSYMGKLKNGTTTMEEQTNLLKDLTGLQALLQGLN